MPKIVRIIIRINEGFVCSIIAPAFQMGLFCLVSPHLFQQRAFAPGAGVLVYIAQCPAGAAENELVAGLVILLVGVESSVVPHPVADLIIVIQGIAVFRFDGVAFPLVASYDDGIFQIVFILDIIVTIIVSLGFLFDFLVLHRAVPGLTALSAQYLKQRDHQKHAADTKADIERLRIAHVFHARLAGDIKADHGGDGQNQGEYGRPAVAILDVFGKGRVADAGRESAKARG